MEIKKEEAKYNNYRNTWCQRKSKDENYYMGYSPNRPQST